MQGSRLPGAAPQTGWRESVAEDVGALGIQFHRKFDWPVPAGMASFDENVTVAVFGHGGNPAVDRRGSRAVMIARELRVCDRDRVV